MGEESVCDWSSECGKNLHVTGAVSRKNGWCRGGDICISGSNFNSRTWCMIQIKYSVSIVHCL